MTVSAIGLKPMHIRPHKGQSVILQMSDGTQKDAIATMVHAGNKSGIILYHKGRAVDESKCLGWFPSLRSQP